MRLQSPSSSLQSHTAYVALGSNLGDRKRAILEAVDRIARDDAIRVLRLSSLYETEPVGLPPGAEPFLNGVVEVETTLSPRALLDHLLAIEAELGRVRSPSHRVESRIIDLDILLFDDVLIQEPGLVIPHPRLCERTFALKPLSELCPLRSIPGAGVTVEQALQRIADHSDCGLRIDDCGLEESEIHIGQGQNKTLPLPPSQALQKIANGSMGVPPVNHGQDAHATAIRNLQLFLLGGASTLAYLYLAFLSLRGMDPIALETGRLTRFLFTMAVLFGLYFLLIAPLLRGRRMESRSFAWAVGFALLFRAILWPTPLILENDLYRYLWDGHMTTQGINPYRYAPADWETRPYRTPYWSKINFPHVPTIYPPTLQIVYAFSETLFPGRVLGMKGILLAFDVATIFLLFALLNRLGLPREWGLVYAWSPLVIKEIANSGHADSVSAFGLVLFLWAMIRACGPRSKRKEGLAAVTLAALSLTKFFGFLLVPLFGKWEYKKTWVIFGITVLLLYLPFVMGGVNPWKGFLIYAREWDFNAVMLPLLEAVGIYGLRFNSATANLFARLVLFGLVLGVVGVQARRVSRTQDPRRVLQAVLVVLGTLVICSPVINPWYLVWLLPVLSLVPNRAWLLLTGLVYLVYIYYYAHTFPVWLKPIEFGLFFAVLVWDYFVKSDE